MLDLPSVQELQPPQSRPPQLIIRPGAPTDLRPPTHCSFRLGAGEAAAPLRPDITHQLEAALADPGPP